MYSKIVNPKTGRQVSINGRLGRQILKNYLIVLNGGTPNQKVCEVEKAAVENLEECINICHGNAPNAETNKIKCINDAQKSARDKWTTKKATAKAMAEGEEISDSPLRDALKNAKLRRRTEEGGKRRMFHIPLKKIAREGGVIIGDELGDIL